MLRSLGLVTTLLGLLLGASMGAAEPEESKAPASSPPTAVVVPGVTKSPEPSRAGQPGLDDLLQLPSGYMSPRGEAARTVSGAGESEWRRRFARASKSLAKAQAALEKTKRELDQVAEGGGSNQWAVAPPGASNSGGPATSPLSFRLRQELVRHRQELDAAEKSLRDLRIEADLAGVPREWRGDSNTPIPRRIPESPYYN